MANIIGLTFNRLTVEARERDHVFPCGQKRALYRCLCECGAETSAFKTELVSGRKKSCGCLRREPPPNKTHGLTQTVIYQIYRGVLNRCYNQNVEGFKDYGARGIRVCDRWRFGDGSKPGPQCFAEDMGPRPSNKHSVERLDVNGDYGPGNCVWATSIEQAANRRRTRKVQVGGRQIPICIVARDVDIHRETLAGRLDRGWPYERAVTQTPKYKSPKTIEKMRAAARRREAAKREAKALEVTP